MATLGPELFIALVGALGTDLDAVSEQIESHLKRFDYEVKYIHLTKILSGLPGWQHLKLLEKVPFDERVEKLMDAGNKLREKAERGDAMILLAINEITLIRCSENLKDSGAKQGENIESLENRPLNRTAYIFRSIKNPDELVTLRKIYGNAVVAISVYGERQQRIKRVAQKIAESRHSYRTEDFIEKSEEIVDRDEREDGNFLGQHIGKTFHLGDAFIKEDAALSPQIQRLVEIIFGHPFRTPTMEEYGIFMARATALRSCDLARQVGAVIMSRFGEIISTGCNEVPLSGGGVFWETSNNLNDELDHRDYKIGFDSTVKKKKEMLQEFFERMERAKLLSSEILENELDKLVDDIVFGDRKEVLEGTRVASILEFGRIVHAEMAAISEAARRGSATAEATLFCTTFPCHMCARHLIAAGIKRVVYIEPYPKSLAKELYPKQLKLEGEADVDDAAVSFEPFVGVAPRRYLEFFEMASRRKDERGYKVKWPDKEQSPRIRIFPAYTQVESGYINFLNENRIRLGLVQEPDAHEGDDDGANGELG